MDVHVLLGEECVDEVALQALCITTSFRDCKINTNKRCVRRIENGILAHPPPAGKQKGGLRSRKKSRGCEPKLVRGRVPRSQVNPRGGVSGLEEGCRMDLEEETEYKKKLDEQKKSLQRQVREIDKFANMDPVARNQQMEAWKKELEEIERKRTELLPEHQKMQKKSQKLQSLRDEQNNHLKTAGECEDEMQKVSKEWEEHRAQYEMRFHVLSEKSVDSRTAAAELENEIQNMQAREERRGSSASQSNGCCFDAAILEKLTAMGAAEAMQQLTYLQQDVTKLWSSTTARANRSGTRSGSRTEGSLGRRM